ncbi:hypothetical protein D3C87_1633610 [compost metagenome]
MATPIPTSSVANNRLPGDPANARRANATPNSTSENSTTRSPPKRRPIAGTKIAQIPMHRSGMAVSSAASACFMPNSD